MHAEKVFRPWPDRLDRRRRLDGASAARVLCCYSIGTSMQKFDHRSLIVGHRSQEQLLVRQDKRAIRVQAIEGLLYFRSGYGIQESRQEVIVKLFYLRL